MAKGTPSKKPRSTAVEVEHKPPSLSAMKTFDEAVAALYSRVDLERMRPSAAVKDQYKLDRMQELLKVMGNPHDNVRCIHVAGTKGKGSTCEMITSALGACGYSIGLFTSPHLVDVRERIRIGERQITKDDFLDLTKRVLKAVNSIAAAHGEATFFEVTTAMAFQYFLEQAVDLAVIEVGLGGLLDCTNVIRPEVCAISTIGMDHMQILGNTIEEIAAQKAGIFKAGVPAVSVPQEASVAAIFREKAREVGCPLQILGQDIEFQFRFEWGGGAGPQTVVSVTTPRCDFEHAEVPLKGEHQAHNCGLALAVIAKLVDHGYPCPEGKVLDGLAKTTLAGRFETVWESPRIIVDVAHNPDSIKALMKAIGAYLTYDSLIVVFGCAADKDSETMLRHLAGGADKVIFTKSQTARAADPQKLMERYIELSDGSACQVAENIPAALDAAARACGRGDIICVTGSFYLVGETKVRLEEVRAKKAAGSKANSPPNSNPASRSARRA